MPRDSTAQNVISAVIITRNEEKNIARCLGSLTWVDEILVVDGGSTDATLQICRDPKASWNELIRVIEKRWEGFRSQRNFALTSAKFDWVLVVDSDEACSDPLAKKIQSFFEGGEPVNRYYKVRRQEYFLGKEINYGIWNPSYQDRFFHRAGIEYINEIHEYPKFPSQPERIHEPLLHSPDFGIEQFIDKMNRYVTIEAKDRVTQGRRTNAFRMIAAFPAMFLKNYFYYKAYRDGMEGFAISILEGISRATRHLKMWREQKSLKQ